MKKSLKDKAFGLFDMYPNTKIPLLAKRSGISKSCLYRYHKQWLARPNPKMQEHYQKNCAKDVQMGVVAGFAAGAMFTIFAFLIAG